MRHVVLEIPKQKAKTEMYWQVTKTIRFNHDTDCFEQWNGKEWKNYPAMKFYPDPWWSPAGIERERLAQTNYKEAL